MNNEVKEYDDRSTVSLHVLLIISGVYNKYHLGKKKKTQIVTYPRFSVQRLGQNIKVLPSESLLCTE